METAIRKIGNSKGVIIPSTLLNQLNIESEVEMTLQDDSIVIRPVTPLRKGWFEGYDASKDVEPLMDMQDLDSEQEDWEW
jgi:antitoxin MazE